MLRNKPLMMFSILAVTLSAFFAGYVFGKGPVNTPNSVIHHVALQWKTGVSDADKAKAIEDLKQVLSEVDGVKNLWVKTLKIQPKEFSQTFVIEFESEAALKAYGENPKKKEWDTFYYNIREQSQNCVTTN